MKRILGEKGQGLTEYAVLLCLIGVSSIAVVSYFGAGVKSKITSLSYAISGDGGKSKSSQDDAVTTADKAKLAATKDNGMEITKDEVQGFK